jgi:hypothetical protein
MKLPTRMKIGCHAFTRVEVLTIMGALVLLTCTTLAGLTNQRGRFDRVACLNNLRMIGQAFQAWGNDHGGETPWWVPPPQGNYNKPLFGETWYQFSWISNQLGSPKILVCPTDWNRRIATNWGMSTEGGFLHSSYRNNGLSYLVGLEARADRPTVVLSGDSNLRYDGKYFCSLGLANCWAINTRPLSPYLAWTNRLHQLSGNLLLNDGRVLQTTNAGLRAAFANQGFDDNGQWHFLTP